METFEKMKWLSWIAYVKINQQELVGYICINKRKVKINGSQESEVGGIKKKPLKQQ